MKVLSLFDGMSCGRVALQRAGIHVTEYHACEIDKYAIKVAQSNFQDTRQRGSVVGFTPDFVPDLIIGGSPCQDVSFAGKGAGFAEGTRSNLFFEYVRILNWALERNPNVKFLLENVQMKKSNLDVITSHLGVNPVMINSALVSAQNRVRQYWANWDFTAPEDRGITWGDVRERGVNDECYYYYTEAAMQWLGRHSNRKNKTLDVHADNEKMQMVEASHYKKYSSQRFFGVVDMPSDEQAVASMRGRWIDPVTLCRDDYNKEIKPEQYIEFRYDGKTNCLSTVSKDSVVVPFTLPGRIPVDSFFFRYVTPIECERLQTLPDNYTASVSNSQRYKMIGNGWTVDVIAHIFKHLK